MRHLLIAAAVAGTVLTAIPSAKAKSIWLNCGDQVITLDSAKETFLLTYSGKIISDHGKIYQGHAMFSPEQIDFEYYRLRLQGDGGIKIVYSINRKSLRYTETEVGRVRWDYPWRLGRTYANHPNPEFGKCSITKTPPTASNQI